MKHRIFGMILILCIIVASFSALVPIAAENADAVTGTPMKLSQSSGVDAAKVRETRFLNMLNHNYVYNDSFLHIDELVNDSIIALLDLRDAENSDFIAVKYVSDYVSSMYGIELADTAQLNADHPQREGYLYIIPRGFTTYSHRFVSALENEDGTWSVITEVTVNRHDGAVSKCKAQSLFVKNDASSFGYNIVYSNILTDTSDL